MKVLLAKDEHIELNVKGCANALNNICRAIRFEAHEKPVSLGLQSTHINLSSNKAALQRKLTGIERDHVVYSTPRQYKNNYFFYSNSDSTILSFFGWSYYTNLPIENGLFHFVATILALRIDNTFRHQNTTGCIYDFLWDKTGVDLGMKTGHICQSCLRRIQESSLALETSDIFGDLTAILEVLSNTSRRDKSVLDFENHTDIVFNWSFFEDEVAELYRAVGATVKQNVPLSGFQVDIVAEEMTPSNQKLRSVIECKFSRNKVGNKTVNDFARVFKTLKEANLADKGVIVSYSGFSKDAHLVSKDTGIELLHFKDLQKTAGSKITIDDVKLDLERNRKSPVNYFEEEELQNKKLAQKSPEVFVIMPFSPDLDDVYYLGMHYAASEAGCSCERVDQMQFDGMIFNKICDSIKNSRVIVAEVSNPNPNVYYELGYAHALGKPTILITRNISSSPFDTRGFNHIIYSNIVDLRGKLSERLSAILMER